MTEAKSTAPSAMHYPTHHRTAKVSDLTYCTTDEPKFWIRVTSDSGWGCRDIGHLCQTKVEVSDEQHFIVYRFLNRELDSMIIPFRQGFPSLGHRAHRVGALGRRWRRRILLLEGAPSIVMAYDKLLRLDLFLEIIK